MNFLHLSAEDQKLVGEYADSLYRLGRAEAEVTYVDEDGTIWDRPTAWAYAQVCKARDKWQEATQQDAKKVEAQHPDDIAVDAFALAMKAKLAKKRAEGRGGWQDKAHCSAEWLSDLLRGHIGKGDPVDVANLAMMLHQRGESITCGNVVSETQRDADKADAQPSLGWAVRERRGQDGELQDCFVEAPAENGMAYGLEVLGDDYTGYGDVDGKMQHCQMIVAWANAIPKSPEQPDPAMAGDETASIWSLIDAYVTACDSSKSGDEIYKAQQELHAALIARKRVQPASIHPPIVGNHNGLIHRLEEYAADSGYSHNDYADTMREAANILYRAQRASGDDARDAARYRGIRAAAVKDDREFLQRTYEYAAKTFTLNRNPTEAEFDGGVDYAMQSGAPL